MKPVFYGLFARFADWYHGWRDGRSAIPPRPGDGVTPDRPVTTAHGEVLIRRAQDAFDHEYTRLEAGRHGSLARTARAAEAVAGAQAELRRAEGDLPAVSVPQTEAELTRRRPGEDARDERIVRLRREREHRRRVEQVRHRIRAREAAVTEARKDLAAAEAEATQHYRVAQARVRRIHEHTHRRLAAYRRRLVRSHPHGGWVNVWMSSTDPGTPGWARQMAPGIHAPRPPDTRRPPPPTSPPEPYPVIQLGHRTVFGSRQPEADHVIDGYGVRPAHFEIVREGDGFRLRAHSDVRAPYVDGRQIRTAWLRPGESFEVADYGFHFTDDGTGVQKFRLGPCDLVVSRLTAKSGDKTRLSEMSLVQRERTVLAILGPSGAGKTSLFSALLGELKHESGQLFFRGLNLSTHGEQIRDSLGFVPQENDLYRALTVRRLLRYADKLRNPKEHHGTRDRRITRICRELGVAKQLDQLVSTLSGGQLKRVSIALEILSGPALLMLDEPTSGLDAAMDREVMTILRRYADSFGDMPRGDEAWPDDMSTVEETAQDGRRAQHARTVIVITHSTEHLHLADQVLVVASEGRPIYLGPPRGELATLGVENYADLMKELTEGDPASLARAFAAGEVAAQAAQEAQAALAPAGTTVEPARLRRQGPASRFRRQLPVLLRRQLALVVARGSTKNRHERGLSDMLRGGLAVVLPFVVAGAAALLAALVSGGHGIGAGEAAGPGGPSVNTAAPAALSLLITLCILTGQALTYSDVVAEFPIIRREHRTGTLPAAVMVSKWMVFAVAAVAQAAIVTLVYTSIRPAPVRSIWLEPTVELFVDLALTTVAAMSLGLLISVVARKLEQAVAMATAAAIAQVALNGVAAGLTDKWFLNYLISFLLPARWGLAAAASSTDLRGISPTHEDALWVHSATQWVLDLAWLLGLTVLCFGAATMLLTRRLTKPT